MTAHPSGTRKAIVQDRYGSADVLHLREVDKPIVADDRVLVKVRAASVNAQDWHLMRGEPYALRFVFGFGGAKGNWVGPLVHVLRALVLSRFTSQRLVPFMARVGQRELVVLKELMEAGKLSPVIDREYGLSEVPDAVRYVEGGHARAKVVIKVA